MPLNDTVRQRLQPLTAVVTHNRILLYFVFSACAVVGAVANACRNQSNFYSVAVYLSRSARSVLLLANFGFVLALLCGRVLQRIFFGPLQPREVERLYDQTWMFVTESLLALTIFRDDFDLPFILMFGFLLFAKCFHWLVQDRVESMDQTTYPGPPTIFHVRMISLFLGLFWIDFIMFAIAIESTVSQGVGGMVLFATEYAILQTSILNAVARYLLSVIDYRRASTRGGENAPSWEHKSMYVFYIELVTDFLKLTTYLSFFLIILMFYSFPLNIVRDVFLTARSFITRVRALIRYHTATRDMDRRYPNATEAELTETSDRTCIICREEMVVTDARHGDAAAEGDTPAPAQQEGPNMTPKKLPCGHIFHFQCLKSWLERQQSCPTCRRPVLETNPRNQAQNQPRQAVPRPGAAPQVGQQPAPGNFFGRLFGFPVPAPAAPAQFPHGQFMPAGGVPPPQQQVGNVGWGPGQMPPPPPQGYYYPLQYAQPPPPQQFQQPPVFQGFHGPGQVWQQWVDPQWLAQAPNQPAQANAGSAQGQAPRNQPPGDDLASSSIAGVSSGPGSQSGTASGPAQRSPSRGATSSRASATGSEPASNPRSAAALAALKRAIPPGDASAASASGSASAAPVTQTPAPTPTTPTIPQPAASSGHSAGAPAGSSPTSAAPTGPPALPPLLPLYDFNPLTGHARPAHATHAYGTYVYPTGAPQGPPSARGPPQPARTERPRPRPAHSATRTPLSQLPPTLTDAQLARLDALTREAIDERLRVLEGVSGAVYRCIEELTRVRSVLPTAAAAAAGTGPAQGGPGDEPVAAARDTGAGGPSPSASIGSKGNEMATPPADSSSSQGAHAGSSEGPTANDAHPASPDGLSPSSAPSEDA